MQDKILILDFGSQYTQLIARRLRELGVFCEIYPFSVSAEVIQAFKPKGIVLSGGPESVVGFNSPKASDCVFTLGCPVLGICYGMQTMAAQLGGKVDSSSEREFGYAQIQLSDTTCALFEGIEALSVDDQSMLDVWMSHGDKVTELPPGFQLAAATDGAPIAAMFDSSKHFYGVQFHPESILTQHGHDLLKNFLEKEPC